MSTIYTRIRKRREELGLSCAQLAERCGYRSRSTIHKIESGLNGIPHKKLEELARALQTTTAWLMEGDKELAPISDEQLKFALFGADAGEISDEQLEDVRRFARFIKEKKEHDPKKPV